ncbi:MAG TPA: nucleotidyltransferase domain-containing protein [Chthoniobacterales bacterium]
MNHGLTELTVQRINEVLSRFPEVESAVLFGSRAKGVHRRGSDVDLALRGNDLDWRLPGRIDDALDEMLLPYRFSLILWNDRTDPEVDAHIRRVGVPLYRRNLESPAK